MNSPVRLGVSPIAASTPKGFSISGLRLYFPMLEPGGCMVCFASPLFLPVYLRANVACQVHQPLSHRICQVLLASELQSCRPSSTIRHLMGSASHCLTTSPLHPAVISAPPTNLDKSFFFKSLVAELPYSSIFCQFWLLSFFWLCEEAQCVYLRLHLARK